MTLFFQNHQSEIIMKEQQQQYQFPPSSSQVTEKATVQIAEQLKKKGNEAFKEKKHQHAIQLYSQAIEINSTEPSYYTNRAICYYNIGEFWKSREDSMQAIGVKEDFAKGWRRKGLAQIQLLMLQEAIQSFKRAEAIEPSNTGIEQQRKDAEDSYKIWQKYGSNVAENNYQEALKNIELLSERIKSNISLKIKKVECLAKAGLTANALTLYRTLSIANSYKSEYWYLKVLIELYGGDVPKAKKIAKEVKKYDEDGKIEKMIERYQGAENLKQEGNQLLKKGQLEAAESRYSEAIKTDPTNIKLLSVLYSNRAHIYIKHNKLQEALQDLNSSINFNSNYIKSYARRAEVFVLLNRFQEAVEDYKKIQQLDPSMNIREKLNSAFKMSKKFEKKDYYKTLGVHKNASVEQIKNSYKIQMAKKNDPKRQKELNEAYNVLKDGHKKQVYDSGKMVYDKDSEFGEFDPNDIFQMFFNGSGKTNRKDGFYGFS